MSTRKDEGLGLACEMTLDVVFRMLPNRKIIPYDATPTPLLVVPYAATIPVKRNHQMNKRTQICIKNGRWSNKKLRVRVREHEQEKTRATTSPRKPKKEAV